MAFEDYINLISTCSLAEYFRGTDKVSIKDFNRWLDDSEHGLFHGLVVGYFATQKEFGLPLLASCIVHDFAKVILKIDKGHDAVLTQFFDGLLPIVYSHSTPSKPDHPLIIGDRIELMRYPDWRNWCQPLIFEYYNQYKDFYDCRDILEKNYRITYFELKFIDELKELKVR